MSRTAFALTALCASAAFAASPPALVNYQGVLRGPTDAPLSGSYDIVFRFFDDAAAGSEILVDSHTLASGGQVIVSGGLFNVQLGTGTVSDGSGAGTYASLSDVFRVFSAAYLEIQIGAEVLSPRTRVLAAAYSLNADHLDGADSSAFAAAAHAHDGSDITTGKISNLRLNTGSGNGLDADTLDGLDASEIGQELRCAEFGTSLPPSACDQPGSPFVVPGGVTTVFVQGCGGGGGGGGGGDGQGGGGGGGAGSTLALVPVSVTPGASITVATGIAGTGGNFNENSNGNPGLPGGDSTFTDSILGELVRFPGGPAGGGGLVGVGAAGGAGGSAGTSYMSTFTGGGTGTPRAAAPSPGQRNYRALGGAGGGVSVGAGGGGGGGAGRLQGAAGGGGNDASSGQTGASAAANSCAGGGGGGATGSVGGNQGGRGGNGGTGYVVVYYFQ